jgi:hypothetical protein
MKIAFLLAMLAIFALPSCRVTASTDAAVVPTAEEAKTDDEIKALDRKMQKIQRARRPVPARADAGTD